MNQEVKQTKQNKKKKNHVRAGIFLSWFWSPSLFGMTFSLTFRSAFWFRLD